MTPATTTLPPLLKEYGIPTVHALEVELGITGTGIGALVRRGAPLSIAVIGKILDRYPDANPAFLVTGKGKVRITKHQEPEYYKLKVPIGKGKFEEVEFPKECSKIVIDLVKGVSEAWERSRK